MSRIYVEASSSADHGHAQASHTKAAREVSSRDMERKHAESSAQAATTSRSSPHDSKVRSFASALWFSLLLAVTGAGLLYRGAGPEGALHFVLGGGSIVIAAALIRSARARMIASFESAGLKEHLSGGVARHRAEELFGEILLPPRNIPNAPPREEGELERLVDRYPLA